MLVTILSHKPEILGLLLAVSEILGAFMPKVKANSIVELAFNMLKRLLS